MSTRHTFRPLDMTYIALFAVLMAICAWISIPVPPIPFSLQTFAVFLALTTLGSRRGLYAILVYLSLGLVGLPMFTGFQGGIGILLGASGGYLLGFVLLALVFRLCEPFLPQSISCLLGLLACYAFGTLWYLVFYISSVTLSSAWSALHWCVLPFMLPDLLKLGLALFLSRSLKKHLR